MTALFLLWPLPAFADVCDKIIGMGDGWTPAHGAVWLLNPLGFPFEWAIVAAGLALVAAFRTRRVGSIVAAVFLALALWQLAPMADWIVFRLAVGEGCVSVEAAGVGAVLMLALAVLSITMSRPTRRTT